jgi:subtilisin-like proprotein convertase family protein
MTQPSIRRCSAVLLVSLGVIVSAGEPLSIRASKAQHGVPRGQEAIDAPDAPGAASGSTVINGTSFSLNVAIPDNTTIPAPINVPAINFMNVVDVNVRVRINHTRASDLDMYLTGPDGTTVQLATDVGGVNNDFGAGATDCTGLFATFDDEAPVFIEASTAPFIGSFRPEGVLSAFDGKPSSGTWMLRITDDAAGDTGALYCWGLTIRRTAIGKAFTAIDGRTELSLWRPNPARLFSRTLQSVTGSAPNGQPGDIPVPADYLGTGLEQAFALFRPSTGQWFNTGSPTVEFGINNDVPVPGDYDGNGPIDMAVWRPSDGNWYLRNIATIPWGISGDIPVPADYNGDGTTDVAVWRPSQGVWYVRNVVNLQWGAAGDIPVPADYTGDGKADIAIFRPSTGYWFIITVDQQQAMTIPWGGMNDIPIPADYDGDGKADIAVFRGSEGLWYIRNVGAIPWGTTGDIPLPKRPTYPGYPY